MRRSLPISIGSGYFAVFFLGSSSEISRTEIPFQPALFPVTAQTGSDGSFSFSVPTPLKTPGQYQVQASYAGSPSLSPALATANFSVSPLVIAVVNAANFKSETLSPGAWFTLYGQNLGTAGRWTASNLLNAGGASVTVCGQAADVSYDSGPISSSAGPSWQLNALIPDGVSGQRSCPVVVTVDGQASQAATVNIGSGIMELFSFQNAAGPLPVVSHSDYSLVGPASAGLTPAQPDEPVVAWGTGDCTAPAVAVAGQTVVVPFSGRVGPGLCQLNFVVPHGTSGLNQLNIST